MDYPTITAIVFGSIGVCGTLVVCTVKITTRIVSMEGIVLGLVTDMSSLKDGFDKHAEDCDSERSELNVKVDGHDRRLNKHSDLLSELGK